MRIYLIFFLLLNSNYLFGTSIAVRIGNGQQEAAVGSDSRRTGIDENGKTVVVIDDICKICEIRNGLFVEAGLCQKSIAKYRPRSAKTG